MPTVRKRRSGFTLIEILVVVIIIGLIASMSTMNFKQSQENAANAQMETNVRTVAMALERYADDNAGTYPSSLVDNAFLTTYMGGKKLPPSPWNTKPQVVQIDCVASAPTDAYWDSLKLASRNHNVPVGDPTIPTRANPPAVKTDQGALTFSSTGSVYHLVGYGRYAGHLAVLGAATNNATGAAAAPN